MKAINDGLNKQQRYEQRMKDRGFVKMAIHVHKDDVEAVKKYAAKKRKAHDK